MPPSDFVGIRIKTCFIKMHLLSTCPPLIFRGSTVSVTHWRTKSVSELPDFLTLMLVLSVSKDTFSAINFN